MGAGDREVQKTEGCMNSFLTLAQVRALLYQYVNPQDQYDPNFLIRLNQVRERLINAGTFSGCVIEGYFATDTDGFITLPPHAEALLAVDVRGWPTPIYSEFNRFTEVGPGLVLPDVQTGAPFFDLGGQFCTVSDIPAGSSGTIRTTLTVAGDAGNVSRYFGKDANGNEIVDAAGNAGENVTLVYPYADTVNTFSVLTRVQKQTSKGRQTVAWVSGSSVTTLAVYQTYETVPQYKRYQIGTVEEMDRYGNRTIAGKCKLRYLPIYAETDPVTPPSLGALKFGLQAILQEDGMADSNRTTALNFWQDAYRLCDQQHKAQRGAARRTLNWRKTSSRNVV